MQSDRRSPAIPDDEAFPRLGDLLDPDLLVAAISRALGPKAPRIERAHIHYVRYKPGTSLLLGADVTADGLDQPVSVTIKAHPHAEGARTLLAKWATRRPADSPLGPPVFALPEFHAVCVAFPNDAALPGLKILARPDRLRLVLDRCVLPSGHRARGHKLVLERVKYKPERRFVARLRIGSRDERTMERKKFWVYARAYTRGEGEPGRAATAALSEILPIVPRPLGHDPELGLYFQEELPGAALAASLPDFADEAAFDAGRCLNQIHASGVVLPRVRSAEALLAELRDTADHLSRLDPDTGGLAREVVRRLGHRLERDAPRAPCHGDYYYHQVLVGEDGMRVVDFDEAAQAHPALDFANFSAHLDWLAETDRLPRRRVRPLREAFARGYGREPPLAREYEAVAWLRLAARPFRNLVPDWRGQTRVALERAHALV